MFSGTLNIKLCEFGDSVAGLIYVYDDKLGFRFAIALLVLLEVLTSPEGTFSAKENWKPASWIAFAGIS